MSIRALKLACQSRGRMIRLVACKWLAQGCHSSLLDLACTAEGWPGVAHRFTICHAAQAAGMSRGYAGTYHLGNIYAAGMAYASAASQQ